MTELEELVQKIEYLEKNISEWERNKQDVVSSLKKTLLILHKHAFIHYIKNTNPESISSLLNIDIEYMLYNLLLEKKLVEVPKTPLLQRLQQVIDKIRPYVNKYHVNIELLSFKPPDTIEISLTYNPDKKTPRNAKLVSKIEQSLQHYCPEITKIIIAK